MAENSFVINTKINSDKAQKKLIELEKKIIELADVLDKAGAAMENMDKNSDAYKEMAKDVETLANEMKGLVDEYKGVEYAAQNATVHSQKMIDALEKQKKIREEMKFLEDIGRGEGYAEYDALASKLKAVDLQIEKMRNGSGKKLSAFLINFAKTFAGELRKTFGLLGTLTKKVTSGFLSIFKHAKKAGSGVGLFNNKLVKMAGALLIFNQIRKGMSSLFQGVQDGFKSLAKYSSEYNAVMSDFKNSLGQVKNNLAAAFEPIMNAVIPMITQLVSWLNTAIEALSMFFAMIGGKNTYTRAKKQTDDYAKSLGGAAKAAKGALAAFDDLNVLEKNSGGGGGAGSTNGNIWEEAAIDIPEDSILGKLKLALENDDWEGFGSTLAEKLKDALNGIDWDKIELDGKGLAEKIAETINGFTADKDTAKAIGHSIAGLLNVAFGFVSEFTNDVEWYQLGEFIATGINQFMKDFDKDDFRGAVLGIASGLAGFINGAMRTLNWGDLEDGIKFLIQTISDGIIHFFDPKEGGVDFKELGTRIGTLLHNVLTDKETKEKVGDALGAMLKAGIDFFMGLGDGGLKLSDFVSFVWDVITRALSNLDEDEKSALAGAIATVLGACLMLSLGRAVLTLGIQALTKGIATKIATALGSKEVERTVTSGASTLGNKIGSAVVYAAGAFVGLEIGNAIGNAITGEDNSIGDYLGAMKFGWNPKDENGQDKGLVNTIVDWAIAQRTILQRAVIEQMQERQGNMDTLLALGAVMNKDDAKKYADMYFAGLYDEGYSRAQAAVVAQKLVDDGIWTLEDAEAKMQEFVDKNPMEFYTEISFDAAEDDTKKLLGQLEGLYKQNKLDEESFIKLQDAIIKSGGRINDLQVYIGNLLTKGELTNTEFNELTKLFNNFTTTEAQTALDGVATSATEAGNAIQAGLISTETKVKTAMLNAGKVVKTTTDTAVKDVKSALTESGLAIKSGIIEGSAKTEFDATKAVIDTALDAAKAATDSMVSSIAARINDGSIVKAAQEVSDAVKKILGDIGAQAGVAVSGVKVNIPKLATGGITVGSTIANIGEAGREAVLPLENNTGWMDTLASKLADRMPSGGGSGTVVMTIDGSEFARLNMPYMNAENNRIGVRLANA